MNQSNKKQELVLSALNNLVLNEPDNVLDLYESFKHSSDPDVFRNDSDQIDTILNSYSPSEVLECLDSKYSYYGDKYARFNGTLESGNDLTKLIDFDELARNIADSENAPRWFDDWVDKDDLQEAITDYIIEESSHTEIESEVRAFIDDYSFLSINGDWDDLLYEWENEREEDDE